jgi:hypothetical protein
VRERERERKKDRELMLNEGKKSLYELVAVSGVFLAVQFLFEG